MAELKTKQTEADVHEFINSFTDTQQKRNDSLQILKLMEDVSGYEPRMWGSSMIGYSSYHYKSERSTKEGDWFLIGFSPRKAAISLYVYTGCAGQERLLNDLGKFKMGKSCIYIKKLSNINTVVLGEMIKTSVEHLESKYGRS